MTQTGQVTLFHWKETTLGLIPTPAPTGARARFISENLFVGPNKVDSPEVTPGNEPEDTINNGFEGGGDIEVAMTPKNFDDWLECLLWNTWADPAGGITPVRVSGIADVTYTSATRTLDCGAGWTNTPAAGDKILVWGSGNAYLDGIHTVDPTSSPTGTDIILEQDGILSSSRVPDISVPLNIRIIRGKRLTNSLTPAQIPLGFEKRIARTRGKFLASTATAGAPVTDYSVFLAMMATRCQMRGTGTSPITATWSWEASREKTATGASTVPGVTVLGGTSEPYPGKIFQGINSIKKLRVFVPSMSAAAGDAGKIEDTWRFCPQSFALELANGMVTEQLMCAEPEKDYNFTEPLFQLQAQCIYDSPFPREAYDKELDAVVELAMVNDDGEGYLFKAARCKVLVARRNTPGRRQIMSADVTIKAYRQTAAPAAGDSARAMEIYRFYNP
jgi:hypothetical protein